MTTLTSLNRRLPKSILWILTIVWMSSYGCLLPSWWHTKHCGDCRWHWKFHRPTGRSTGQLYSVSGLVRPVGLTTDANYGGTWGGAENDIKGHGFVAASSPHVHNSRLPTPRSYNDNRKKSIFATINRFSKSRL